MVNYKKTGHWLLVTVTGIGLCVRTGGNQGRVEAEGEGKGLGLETEYSGSIGKILSTGNISNVKFNIPRTAFSALQFVSNSHLNCLVLL
jgi:hypothetical protein